MGSSSSSLTILITIILLASQALALQKRLSNLPAENALGIDIIEGHVRYDDICMLLNNVPQANEEKALKLIPTDFNVGLLKPKTLSVTYVVERTLTCVYYVFIENRHDITEYPLSQPTIDDCKKSKGVIPKPSTECGFMAGNKEMQRYQVAATQLVNPRVVFDQHKNQVVLDVMNASIELGGLDQLRKLVNTPQLVAAENWCIEYELTLQGCEMECKGTSVPGFTQCDTGGNFLYKELARPSESPCAWTNLFQFVCDGGVGDVDVKKCGPGNEVVLDEVALSAKTKLLSTEISQVRTESLCESCKTRNVYSHPDGLYCHDRHMYKVNTTYLDISQMIDAGNFFKIHHFVYDPTLAVFVNYHDIVDVEKFQYIPKYILVNFVNGLFNCSITKSSDSHKVSTECNVVRAAGDWVYTPSEDFLNHFYTRTIFHEGVGTAKTWWQQTTSVISVWFSGLWNGIKYFFSFEWLKTTLLVVGTVACIYVGWKVYRATLPLIPMIPLGPGSAKLAGASNTADSDEKPKDTSKTPDEKKKPSDEKPKDTSETPDEKKKPSDEKPKDTSETPGEEDW